MAGAEKRRAGRLGRDVAVVLLVLGLLVAGRALVLALRHRVPLLLVQGPRFWGAVLVLLASVLVLALVLFRNLSGRAGVPVSAALRQAFVVAVIGWCAFLAFVQPFQRLWFDLWAGVCTGAWGALLLMLARPSNARARLIRVLDVGSFLLCVSLLALELGLRVYASASSAPLLVRVGAGPRDILERFRCEPGEVRYGFPCNSRGYYDEEFERTREGERAFVVIGDSFSVGAVPHAWHYTTLCEERIGVPIHSMGIVGIGPPEYLSLLVEEALPLAPEAIVVGLFVGNDLTAGDVTAGLPDPFLRDWFQRERVLFWVLPSRFARVSAERRRLAGRDTPPAGDPALLLSPERAAAAFPWLADPLLEEGTLSREAFLRLETERALSICGQDPSAFAFCVETLLAMQEAAGSAPLKVLLIPDEFQVEDVLWRAVQERAGRELERELPQRFLRGWLEEHGIAYLDLLPVLRAVPPLADGKRHVYHRDDTHWNARGNRVVAEALADFLPGEH